MGFSVDWFTEGRQGKEALYSAPYDAVILDLTLPGMDGGISCANGVNRENANPY